MRTVAGLLVLVVALLVVAWYAFDYGRTRAGGGDCSGSRSVERIAALERERDELKRRLAELEVLPVPEDVRSEEEAPVQEVSDPDEQEQPGDVTGTDDVGIPPDGRLRISATHLEAIDSPNRFEYGFTVDHANGGSAIVTGTIWIAVNGSMDDRPTRLSLKKVSPDRSTFIKMRFERKQLVEGELLLPDGFSPRNLFIEVKPVDKDYSGVSEVMEWPAGG